MEVTTVSPSPASPTEGADLYETDVTNVAIHSVALPICLCGLAGNGAVLRLLSLEVCNTDFFNLAFADFICLLFTFPSTLLFLAEDVSCSPIMPQLYLSFLFQLSMVSVYWVLFMLIFGSSTVSIRKLCMLCCHRDLPKRLEWFLNSVQLWALYSLFTVIPAVTYLCPSQEQEHCRAALISMYAIILFLFVAPVLTSITMDLIKARRGSKKLKPKRRNVVISLVVLFVLLLSLCNFLQQLGYNVVSSQVLFLLNCTHSSIKPFIYFLAGRCWSPCALSSLRLSLRRVFVEQKGKVTHSDDAPKDNVL